jgi:hypothetical protein
MSELRQSRMTKVNTIVFRPSLSSRETVYSFLRLFFSGRFRTRQPLRRSAAAQRLIMRDIEKFTLIDL